MANILKLTQKRVQVVSSGTRVPLSGAPLLTTACLIVADPDNSGVIWVGDSSTLASTKVGVPLSASDDIDIDPARYTGTSELLDLSEIYIDSTASGDYVIVSYYEREVL